MFAAAFLFGLASSLHCVGMCGPIALMLPVDRSNPSRRALQIMTYQAGRLLAYGSIGLIFGLVGKGFYLAGFQQKLSIVAGFAMILIAIVPERRLAAYNFSGPVMKMISNVRSRLGKAMRNGSFKSMLTIGILNGFLPCGMVYAALFGAVAMQDVPNGILFMLLFGLGTAPLMSAAPYLQNLISAGWRQKIQKIVPVITAAVGVLFVMRGLGLGIPYVSPSEISLFIKSNPDCY